MNKETQRIHAMVLRRLQTAGQEGLSANDFASMVKSEFPNRGHDACRNILIRMANAGIIYRRPVVQAHGGLQSHYFAQADWRDAYVKALPVPKLEEPASPPQEYVPIPKYGAQIEYRDGIKVTVCEPYKADYRLHVDPSHSGSFMAEWQAKRAQA